MANHKKGRIMPINNAPTGGYLTPGTNSFYQKKHRKPEPETKRTRYRVEFVKRFDNVSANDARLQTKYGINLISEYLHLKKEYINLKQRKKKEEILHTDRVYYVRRGKDVIGKLCIREQRTFKGTHLIFIFKTRHIERKLKEEE